MLAMIKLMTRCRNIATVLALSFWLPQAIVAQESFTSFPTLESGAPQSVLDLPQIPEVPEDLNVLTRGPLHEAFASAHQADPQPATLVFKAPPELIDEVPPEYKPEGNNVQWISGYWAWDDAQSDFIWISGIWRDVPPKRRWIPGYWNAENDGHRWVSGIWTEETQLDLGYLPEPPASIDQGPSTTAPGEEYFYVPGNWDHQNGNYRWLAGHWQPVVENWIWIPSRYVWTPNGCVYQAGYWDYEFQNRGTCFAPVQFTQPVYLTTNYSYRPSYALNLNVNFMTHLFVRPRCGHYFYGDWYASSFNNVRYQPWVSYSSHRRSYDPLLTYYRCRRSSFDSRYNVVQHLTRQHNFYANNRDYRPRPTYKSQHKHSKKIRNLHAHGSHGQRRPHEDYLRNASYVQTYQDLRKRIDNRGGKTVDARHRGNLQHNSKKHRKVAEQELRETRRKVEQRAKVQRDRKQKELAARHQISRKPSGKTRMQNIPSIKERENEQARARDKALQVAAEARRRQQQVTRVTTRKPTSSQRTGDRNNQRSVQNERRTQPTRNIQQEQTRLANQQNARQQQNRDSARKLAQQHQAAQAKLENARRAQQDQARKRALQDQAKRIQQPQHQVKPRFATGIPNGKMVSRAPNGKTRMQNIPSIQQREQAARQAQQDRARSAAQKSQRDAAARAQQQAQQDQARRAQQAAANRAKQDQARRAQQDQARRAQQAAARQVQLDQARRTQQDQARRAQQERSQQQAAQRARQQQSQRDAARRAQQQAQRDSARRAQANRQKSAQPKRSSPPQESRASRLRNRSSKK